MKNKGFSLVELIVVIAIMAILVGVAVPVYTSYIEKSQKAKDEQLVGEIIHAIEIGMVGAQIGEGAKPADFTGSAVIILSGDSDVVIECSDEDYKNFVKTILDNTFGEASLRLEYDGWKAGVAQTVVANFTGSSFENNEAALLEQVQILSGVVSGFAANDTLASAVGPGLLNFFEEKNITDDNAKGNATILYVAETMTKEGATSAADLKDKLLAFANAPTVGEGEDKTIDINHPATQALITSCGGSTGAAAATMYAIAESYAQASGQAEVFHADIEVAMADVSNSNEALNKVLLAYQKIAKNPGATVSPENYVANGSMLKDVEAYLSVMKAVDDSEASVLANANSENCFTDGTMLNKLKAYMTVGQLNVSDGQVAIVVTIDQNGNYSIVSYPIGF